MALQEIDIGQLQFNPFTKIGQEWLLIAAGDKEKHNAMTASFGGIGVLWFRNVATVFIRPQRYTISFVEEQPYYSLSFFDETYREALTFCGKNSGRDVDKVKATGLTPNFTQKAPFYEEASLVLICRKLYKQNMTAESFLDKTIVDQIYSAGDFHSTYVGAIETVLARS